MSRYLLAFISGVYCERKLAAWRDRVRADRMLAAIKRAINEPNVVTLTSAERRALASMDPRLRKDDDGRYVEGLIQ